MIKFYDLRHLQKFDINKHPTKQVDALDLVFNSLSNDMLNVSCYLYHIPKQFLNDLEWHSDPFSETIKYLSISSIKFVTLV